MSSFLRALNFENIVKEILALMTKICKFVNFEQLFAIIDRQSSNGCSMYGNWTSSLSFCKSLNRMF